MSVLEWYSNLFYFFIFYLTNKKLLLPSYPQTSGYMAYSYGDTRHHTTATLKNVFKVKSGVSSLGPVVYQRRATLRRPRYSTSVLGDPGTCQTTRTRLHKYSNYLALVLPDTTQLTRWLSKR